MKPRENPAQDEPASTYFVYDRRHDKEEIERLTRQDQMVTQAMGGVLAEQPAAAAFRRVLDIGCGPGGWVLEAANQFPQMELVGIDSSPRKIASARQQARGQSRVTFQVMDALRPLAFPADTFDLVNLRFGVSFIRQWEWPGVISELLRVSRPGGVVRLTEAEIVQHSSSQALKLFQKLLWSALHQAGHLWEDDGTGLMTHLAPLLERAGARDVQTRGSVTVYQAGTPEGAAYVADVTAAMHTLKAFIKKWEYPHQEYEQVCRAAREQMQRPDFYAIWQLLTAWGIK